MAPTPNELRMSKLSARELPYPPEGEEVVITGISGSFPDSNGMNELRDNLMNKRDLVTDDERRWSPGNPEVPQRTGKLLDIEKFDAAFFGVHAKQAEAMDPILRIALERSYEAIADAGVNPNSLRGTKCSVIIGCSLSESEKEFFVDKPDMEGYGITGNTRAMIANRISYWLGVEGESSVIDSACSSASYAIERAYRGIRLGTMESALVLGAHLCLNPFVSLQFYRLRVLSDDGRCKCFDEGANGYVRSEAIVAVYLQKAKDARRVYARIVHAKTNCDGFKDHGITFPGRQMQEKLLRDCYLEANIPPQSVVYFEAHATGTKVGDPEEVKALDELFCVGRKEPLLVGSIKSNLGHSEPSSGICSVAKAIIAMETGVIPPNLNFNKAREEIEALIAGRIKVVSEPTPLPDGLIGVNSFGFGGANAHIILKKNEKTKIRGGMPSDNIPRLLTVSGRTKEAVEVILNSVSSKQLDTEFVHLLNLLFAEDTDGHNYRGYGVYTASSEIKRALQATTPRTDKPNFIFSGLGTQNTSTSKKLLRFPPFLSSIEESQRILLPLGVDVLDIVTGDDDSLNNDIINAIVSIVAVQIALIDTLAAADIYPALALGYSIGELSAAYSLRDITAEQALLAAFHIGKTLRDSNIPKTATILVGMGSTELSRNMPSDVVIASINGDHSTTITGPPITLRILLNALKVNGISAEEINTVGFGLNTKYIASAEKVLLEELKKIIPHCKPRSKQWISSSLELHSSSFKRNTDKCCAEFFLQAILQPVFLHEATSQLPKDKITLEIGSDAFIEKILYNAFINIVVLAGKDSNDASTQFLSAVGRLYLEGYSVIVPALYPPISLPVSRGTPMISPLIRWDHDQNWHVSNYKNLSRYSGRGDKIVIDLKREDSLFLTGHVIDGRTLYPATGYLQIVWLTFISCRHEVGPEDAIIFRNVKFVRATSLQSDGSVELFLSIQPSSGQFEVTEGGSTVVAGVIELARDLENEKAHTDILTHGEASEEDKIVLNKKEIYTELRLRGYSYAGLFRGLESADCSGRSGTIAWNENWVAFMDAMLQIQILNMKNRDLYVPVGIEKIVIDPKSHLQALKGIDGKEKALPINYYKDLGIIKAGGVEIWNLRAQLIARRKPLSEPVLERYSFQPHSDPTRSTPLNVSDALRLALHLALENAPGVKIKILELVDEVPYLNAPFLAPTAAKILSELPLIQQEVKIMDPASNPLLNDIESRITIEHNDLTGETGCFAVIGCNVLQRPQVLESALMSLKSNGYIITRESTDVTISRTDISVILKRTTEHGKLFLIRKKNPESDPKLRKVIKVPPGEDFSWIPEVQSSLSSVDTQEIILYAQNDNLNGILGFTNCLIKEADGEKIRCVFIKDSDAPPFNIDLPLYSEQLEKGLVINVLEDGTWGSYRHSELPKLSDVAAQHVYVDQTVMGDLSTLSLYEGPLNSKSMRGELKRDEYIQVFYSALNFRDIVLALGKITLPSSSSSSGELFDLGLEFSGITSSGERVCGFVKSGALTTMFPVSGVKLLWKIPDDWSLEDGASFSTVYMTVYQAIIEAGNAKRGESILIHSAAGGIGIAAINVAIGLGLDIFVTVGTEEKISFIKENYPQIPLSHIGNSRDTSFENMIKKETGNRGVDFVLNSLADDKLEASLRCLAVGGRFLEIGKYDLMNNVPLALDPFLKHASYHAIMLDIVEDLGPTFLKHFVDKGQNLLKESYVKPLPRTVFSLNESEKAFRYMTSGKHVGKVLLKVQDEKCESTPFFKAKPRFFCEKNASYVIIGGLGGFGLELANWLTMRGAKNLVLTSRNGVRTGYQAGRISLWRKRGVEVMISIEDVTTERGVEKLLKDSNSLGHVAAIFNLAVVLKDSIFNNQTKETFKASFVGKGKATEILDRLTRIFCPKLEHFVVFSSVSCGRGNAGQTNYGMSNSVMERICEKRASEGLPGLAIQWGAIGDVGIVAEMTECNQEMVIGGTLQQNIASCLQCLERFLKQKEPVVASMVVAEKKTHFGQESTVVETVAVILGVRDLKMISYDTTLSELGMDSMTAVEIKQCLEREFEVFVTAQDLRSLTFAKLAEYDGARTGGVQTTVTPAAEPLAFQFLIRNLPKKEDAAKALVVLPGPQLNKSPVFFIAGVDALTSLFDPLSERLLAPSVALSYPYNSSSNSSANDTAKFMLKTLDEHYRGIKTVTLVAHSGGCLAAIELASFLEELDRSVEIILLDGSPALVSHLMMAINIGTTTSEIENSVLFNVYESLFKKAEETVDRKIFENVSTWDEKFEIYRQKVGTISEHSDDHLAVLTKDLVNRFVSLVSYRRLEKDKITSKITLIRPAIATAPTIGNDYQLSKVTTGPVVVHTVDADHLSMLSSEETADIINKILDMKEVKNQKV